MDTTSNAVGGIRETAIRKKKKKKTDGEKRKARERSHADKQCGLIQRKISATHSYGHTLKGPLLLSRLPEVPRAPQDRPFARRD